jgi:hypothetical protein
VPARRRPLPATGHWQSKMSVDCRTSKLQRGGPGLTARSLSAGQETRAVVANFPIDPPFEWIACAQRIKKICKNEEHNIF